MKSLFALIGTAIMSIIFCLVLVSIARLFIEARYISSSSMAPSLSLHDRVLVEKVKTFLRRPYSRGEIIVFYPPPIEMGGKDRSSDPAYIMGRLTGLPGFPNEPTLIKRVIGLPGDVIRIQAGHGVYVNGQLLDESDYIKDSPNYNLEVLGDIKGKDMDMRLLQFESDPQKMNKPIIVPRDQLFTLGDNRNNSEDSHVWGFVPRERVIGRVYLLYLRKLDHPHYPPL
jgi:signal peptidase I